MFIDNEELLNSVKESAISTYVETLNKLKDIWKVTTIPHEVRMPVLFIPCLFNGFKFEEGVISFIFEAPIILNVEGDLTDECYKEVYEYIESNPKTMCYGLLIEDNSGVFYIEFEDVRECTKIECNKNEEGILVCGDREKSIRIPILSFHSDSFSPN